MVQKPPCWGAKDALGRDVNQRRCKAFWDILTDAHAPVKLCCELNAKGEQHVRVMLHVGSMFDGCQTSSSNIQRDGSCCQHAPQTNTTRRTLLHENFTPICGGLKLHRANNCSQLTEDTLRFENVGFREEG